MTYPNTATKTDGPTKDVQPLAIAMAGAVAGPPTLALDAMIASSKLKLNILAPVNNTSIFTATTIAQNTRSNGAVFIIAGMDAGVPITTMKIIMRNIPISCAPFIEEKKSALYVANSIVNVVSIKYIFPSSELSIARKGLLVGIILAKKSAISMDTVTIITELAKANAMSLNVTWVAFQPFEELELFSLLRFASEASTSSING